MGNKKKEEITFETMKNCIQFFQSNSNNPEILFDERCNPFLKNSEVFCKKLKLELGNNFYYLKNTNYKIREKGETDELSKRKEVIQERLKYLLLCTYAFELKTGRSMFQYCPPFDDRLIRYALLHRQHNYEYYKKMYKHFTETTHLKGSKPQKNSFYLNNDTTLKNILEKKFGDVHSDENLWIDDKTQHDLIYNVKKTPIFIEPTKNENDKRVGYYKYYIGEYKGKSVLFTEYTKYYKNLPDNQRNMSYQLSVAVNGDIYKNRLIYRMDFEPKKNHINKCDKDGKVNINYNNEDIDILLYHNVAKCHVHIPTERYSVLFPNFMGSADATEQPLSFKNFDEFIKANKKIVNVDEKKVFMTEDERKNFLKQKNVNSFKLKMLFEEDKTLD